MSKEVHAMTEGAASPSSSNISDREFWSLPAEARATSFAQLRHERPVSFQAPSNFGLGRSSGRGFWAVTRHSDVQLVSRNPKLFCSGQGVGMGEAPKELLELNASFLVMDAPEHTELRRIVSGAFTPRRVAQLQDRINEEATQIVDDFVDAGGGDVVADLAMKLPLWTISEMMGVPESLRGELYRAAEAQIAAQDPEFAAEGGGARVAMEAAGTLHAIAAELIAARRAEPTDDILSTLVHSEAGGEPLSDPILGAIFVLFATAGNDTTRTTTSHGVKLFAEHPEQWSRLASEPELVSNAVEELVRYATPVIHFRRTTTAATELAGVEIAEGDAVVMFYESANRDELVFVSPYDFDIARSPNPHVGFGGGGAHFCLGANLARAQLRALFGRLSKRASTLMTGPPEYLISNFSHGVKRMAVEVTPRRGDS
jgi:cytochrome P450